MEAPCDSCCGSKTEAAVNFRDSKTPLMRAAVNGHDQCASALIHAGADVNATAGYNKTALMCAAKQGNNKCIEILLRAGADVNTRGPYGATVLMQALKGQHYKCIDALLEAGANANVPDNTGDMALHALWA